MSIALKDNAYLTLAETKAWLKIKDTNTDFDDIVSRLINTACARVESFIEGPVLNRDYVEYADGNGSNVIVPSMYPVKAITEIKIDFNRNFGSATALNEDSFVLRGIPAMSQPSETPVVEINGTDIVLRDDANIAILGHIYTGSVVQAIKMTYTAGRGETAADLPDDLVTATLMLIDYLYITKENRELGVGSKGVMGQSYSKKKLGDSGMPEEIEAILKEYKDYSLPAIPQPQRNTFKI